MNGVGEREGLNREWGRSGRKLLRAGEHGWEHAPLFIPSNLPKLRPTPPHTVHTCATLSPIGTGLCGERVANTPIFSPLSRGTWILALSPERSPCQSFTRSEQEGQGERGATGSE